MKKIHARVHDFLPRVFNSRNKICLTRSKLCTMWEKYLRIVSLWNIFVSYKNRGEITRDRMSGSSKYTDRHGDFFISLLCISKSYPTCRSSRIQTINQIESAQCGERSCLFTQTFSPLCFISPVISRRNTTQIKTAVPHLEL